MSKRTYFKRYIWLIDTIRVNKYISYNEIAAKFDGYLQSEFNSMGFSKRTFHRDQSEIAELFGIEIKYHQQHHGYYLNEEIGIENSMSIIGLFQKINALQQFGQTKQYITAEPPIKGNEYLILLLDAIQRKRRVRFRYLKYVDDIESERIVEPYFIKEFKGRWYLIAKDKKDLKTKSFALDRIANEPISEGAGASFDIPMNNTAETFYRYSYGIFRLEDALPEDVILAFQPLKGKFIKSNPLHHSQQIVLEDETQLVVTMHLQITHDFIMELLSHGSELKVVEPSHLQQIIRNEHIKAAGRY